MTKLNEKAMLVKLSVRAWTARKYDKAVSKKVEKTYSAKNAGRYNKILIAKEAPQEVTKHMCRARGYHYEQTLPWHDDGYRLLPAENYMAYTAGLRDLQIEFDKAVDAFVQAYPDLVEDAKERLNGMFNPADYPAPAEIKTRFGCEAFVMPLPEASDFRVSLQAGDVETIRADIEKRVRRQVADSMGDLWKRLYEVVEKASEKLSDPKAIFRDSLVQNMIDICKLLPNLNVTKDKELEAMRQAVETKLCGYTPGELRIDKKTRKAAAKRAADIMDAMSAYMGA